MTKYFLGILASFFWSTDLLAFVPDLGHLVRHQPTILRGNPQAFTVDGSIEVEGERAPFHLSWAGVKNGYTVEFKKIPASWTNSPVNDLLLYRDGGACMLVVNRAPYPCSALRFWGDFEFNASSDRVVQTIAAIGLASSADMSYRPVNSKEIESRRPTKVKPAVKSIQGTFMSVLEFPSSGASFLDFDSTTFAPLMASFPVDGMQWELSGSPNFYLEKEENRNNLIISRRIDVREGEKLIASVRREPLKRGTNVSLPSLPSTRGSGSDVPYDRFTEKGRNFLKVLFLTH